MTIRNFLPGFGMRTVAALAVAAAMVVASLLAVGSPASAQTSADGDVIYSGTMTVGANGGIRGYYNIGSNAYGALNPSTIDSPAQDSVDEYSIFYLIDTNIGTDKLSIGLSQKLHQTDENAMRLHIGGRTYNFADAGFAVNNVGGDNYHTYSWNFTPSLPRFNWATGTTVAVKITALPIITIEAVTTTVEYGGNNNVAESTAEFRFTRTGSAKNALSFELTNGGVFSPNKETVTRTFRAGVSSFSNFHWAVDVDSSNNPVCLIIWTVRSGSGYVLGSPHEVSVTVSGPGTTCSSTM